MSNTVKIPVEPKFSKEQEIYKRVHDLIHEYDGEVSMVSVVGILELLKTHVMESTG